MPVTFPARDGALLAYRDEGAGLPLLCLPGLTRTMADFDYMIPHLPAGIRLIRMDYRGRGDSQWTGAATYTVPQEAQDALALITRAAEGSVRDAMSLMDQAIAHGAGETSAAQVRAMLGLADRGRVLDLFDLVMKGACDLGHVEMLVLDECDQMLDLGFVHDLKRITGLAFIGYLAGAVTYMLMFAA